MPEFSQPTLGCVRDALDGLVPQNAHAAFDKQQFWKQLLFDSGIAPAFIEVASSYAFNWTEIIPDLFTGKFGDHNSYFAKGMPQYFCESALRRLAALALSKSKDSALISRLRQSMAEDGFAISPSLGKGGKDDLGETIPVLLEEPDKAIAVKTQTEIYSPSVQKHTARITDVEREIINSVISRFLGLKQATPRRELVVKFKEPELLDGLVTKCVLDRIDRDGKQAFVPKLLAFHYGGDPQIRGRARTSLEIVLYVLHNLFLNELEEKNFTPEEVEAHARKMYRTIDAADIWLGLCLVREFNVLGSYATNPEGTELKFLAISERIVTLKDISDEWDNRVQILSRYIERNEEGEDESDLTEGPLEFFEAERIGPQVSPLAQEPKVEGLGSSPDRVPRAFVSYSHDSPEHRQWVIEFASRLQTEGVEVILDKWHLRRGADKTIFMEESIARSDFVILVCTDQYAGRANERKGGVGYEALIITGELAENIKGEKFIPILREGEFESALPAWIKTKLGVDLRGNPYREDEYEDLLRTLHQEPISPPPIGPKPRWQATTHKGHPTIRQPAATSAFYDRQYNDKDQEQWDETARLAKGMVLEGRSPLSAERHGDLVTIVISAFGARFNERSSPVYYSSGSISTPASEETYYVFTEDPERKGGAVTYQATLTRKRALTGSEKIYIGSIRVRD